MFALAAARDLVIAILIAVILGAALGGLSRREARQTPTIYYGAANPSSPMAGADHCRAASCRAAFSFDERR